MPSQLRSSISLQVMSGSTREPKLNPLKLASSTPEASSSSSTSPTRVSLKRKASNMASDPEQTPSHPKSPRQSSPSKRSRIPPSPISIPSYPLSGTIGDEPADPPSPVPTEIIDIEAEDFVRTAKSYGVKVRDYAYERPARPLSPIPEMWKNPFLTLLAHDMHVRRPADPCFYVSGRLLRRLLDIGYVSQEEADAYWTREDHKLLEEYDTRRPEPYPYIVGFRRPKPTAAYRAATRKALYGEPKPGDLPDEHFKVPDDGTWEGDEESQKMVQRAQETRARALALRMTMPVLGLDPRPPPPPRDPTPEPPIPAPSTPVATPPLAPVALPEETATHRSPSGLLGSSSRANVPSTPTTPPAPATPTTPTSPPATATPPQASGSRRQLGRTTTMHTIIVR